MLFVKNKLNQFRIILNLENSRIVVLLNGCKRNHRNSQKQLYFLLFSFALRICDEYNLGKEKVDVVNQGFLNLFKNINHFNGDNQQDLLLAVQTWFERILREAFVDHHHKLSFTKQTPAEISL